MERGQYHNVFVPAARNHRDHGADQWEGHGKHAQDGLVSQHPASHGKVVASGRVAKRGCPIGIVDDGDGVDVPIVTMCH